MYYLHPRFPGSIPKFKPQKQQQQQQITHTHTETLSQEHARVIGYDRNLHTKNQVRLGILPRTFCPLIGIDQL